MDLNALGPRLPYPALLLGLGNSSGEVGGFLVGSRTTAAFSSADPLPDLFVLDGAPRGRPAAFPKLGLKPPASLLPGFFSKGGSEGVEAAFPRLDRLSLGGHSGLTAPLVNRVDCGNLVGAGLQGGGEAVPLLDRLD